MRYCWILVPNSSNIYLMLPNRRCCETIISTECKAPSKARVSNFNAFFPLNAFEFLLEPSHKMDGPCVAVHGSLRFTKIIFCSPVINLNVDIGISSVAARFGKQMELIAHLCANDRPSTNFFATQPFSKPSVILHRRSYMFHDTAAG